MTSLVMTLEERQSFLAEPHVGVIAVERRGRAPLAVPVWYDYEPGGDMMIWIHRGSIKHQSIVESGRFSLLVQRDKAPYKYVTAEGDAIVEKSPPTRQQALQIARRYLSAVEAGAYVDRTLGDGAVLVRMRPRKWLSSDYSREATHRQGAVAAVDEPSTSLR